MSSGVERVLNEGEKFRWVNVNQIIEVKLDLSRFQKVKVS